MAVTTTYATYDNYIISDTLTSLTVALYGTGTLGVANSADPDMLIGRGKSGSRFFAWEAFQEYTVTPPAAGRRLVAGHAMLNYFGADTDVEIRAFDFGSSLTTANWRTPPQLTALDLLAAGTDMPSGWHNGATFGAENMISTLTTGGTVRVVECTLDQRLEVATTSYLYVGIESTEVSGTTKDPRLSYSTVPESTLDRVGGAQAQLSDGTWLVLDSDGDPTTPTITLDHVSLAGSATTIATLATGATSTTFGYPRGGQGLALVVDADDNAYVIGKSGAAANTLAAQAFTYSGGTWTAGTVRTAAMPTSGGTINQTVAAWHDIGTSGTVLALVAHGYTDPGQGTDVAYAALACDYLLTGSGSLLRASGSAATAGFTQPAQAYTTSNATGSGMDLVAQSATRGYALSAYLSSGTPPGELGSTLYTWAARYVPSAGGTSFTVAGIQRSAPQTYVDAEAKTRILAVDDTRMIIVSARPATGYGLVVEDLQNLGTATSFAQIGVTYLDGETASMPSAAALASSMAWDAVYDAEANAVYVYYVDTASDPQRVIRTTVDLATHLAAGDEEVISASAGASGSVNHVLRVARGPRTADATLVTLANETSGGALSTIYLVDASNLPPTAPTLTAKTNYDGDASASFAWTFNDPNAGDTQSAFRIQINSASGASAYDSGKTVSSSETVVVPGGTLSNPGDWQWRVLTYDALDTVGEWSGYGTFSTSDSGVLNITDPAADNPTLTSSTRSITWSVTGVTQDHYRVHVINTVTSADLVDTGFVASASTTYDVAGMASDVQYRVEVTGRASGVETNTDTVLLTPDYASPDTPVISVTSHDADGYVLISVSNPTPTGDRPTVLYNDVLRRESGSAGAYTVLGSAPTNGTLRDYTAGSGITYEYVARAQA